MKRLTLDQTWKLCLSMWRWIAKQIREGSEKSVAELKAQWATKHGYEELHNLCFFCAWVKPAGRYCAGDCPGEKVEKNFDCNNAKYDYEDEPIAFCNKLVSLNRKRLAKRKK